MVITLVDTITKSGVRRVLDNYRISSDFEERLDEKVKQMLYEAGARAEANSRKTVQAHDL